MNEKMYCAVCGAEAKLVLTNDGDPITAACHPQHLAGAMRATKKLGTDRLVQAVTEVATKISEEREPPEPDGECFRGHEAEAYQAEQQAWIQRNLK